MVGPSDVLLDLLRVLRLFRITATFLSDTLHYSDITWLDLDLLDFPQLTSLHTA